MNASGNNDMQAEDYAWRATLLGTPETAELLGVPQVVLNRWRQHGHVPVAQRVPFRKWGKELEAYYYDPVALLEISGALEGMVIGPRGITPSGLHSRIIGHLRGTHDKEMHAARRKEVEGFLSTLLQPAALCKDRLLVHVELPVEWHQDAFRLSMSLPIPSRLTDCLNGDAFLTDVSTSIRALLSGKADAALLVMQAAMSDWEGRVMAMSSLYSPVQARTCMDVHRIHARALLSTHTKDGQQRACHEVGRLLDEAMGSATENFLSVHRAAETRQEIGMDDYAGLFPAARAIVRKVTFNVGPTNSGKTHAAMAVLAAASSGAYLAPLRLMAMEGAERLQGMGIPCSMVTGEERLLVDGAAHVSSTIETLDTSTLVDVAVIDEVQLVSDESRGWAWTQALFGVPARHVILTGSMDALPYVAKVLSMTGEELDVVHFERRAPLRVGDAPVSMKELCKGDAVIAFSRREVLGLRERLRSAGHRVATIYGALGPEVRRAEAVRFRMGEADVLVSTDAIGMGLNLPIRRVVFSSLRKFDGTSVRQLTASEIRQIGGRAGRYGMKHEGEGQVTVIKGEKLSIVSSALAGASRASNNVRLHLMPPWHAIKELGTRLGNDDLSAILRHFRDGVMSSCPGFVSADMDAPLAVCMATMGKGLALQVRYGYLGCPVNARDGAAPAWLAAWARLHGRQHIVEAPLFGHIGEARSHEDMEKTEDAAHTLTAYMWLSMRFPDVYPEGEAATWERMRLNGIIEDALSDRVSSRKRGKRRK